MKQVSGTAFLLSILVLLCGCGAGGGERTSGALSGTPNSQPNPPVPALNTANNWQFSATSTEGFPSIAIAGSLDQSSPPVSGVVHVDGSTCFDKLTAVNLTGTMNGSSLSLTSAPVAGQVMTLTGSIAEDSLTKAAKFTGTYSIHGGCADGDQGNMTGAEIAAMKGNWAGDLTADAGNTNRVALALTQGNAASEGNFVLTGTASFESGTCFKQGTIASGTFPSGSYVMGTAVSLKIETDNGVVNFLGTAEADGLVRGNYTVVGGTCEPTGTGYLSPWEY